MLEKQILREIKELEKRVVRKVLSKNLLIILIIIEMDLVKWKRWKWE